MEVVVVRGRARPRRYTDWAVYTREGVMIDARRYPVGVDGSEALRRFEHVEGAYAEPHEESLVP